MPTPTETIMINNYALLMQEIKQRIEWLNVLLSGKVPLPNTATQEFGFLQLRIICELIALGCLTAHGDIAKDKNIREEWNATNILKRLERLHPDFYPKPVVVKETSPGHKHLDNIESEFLTKTELGTLYGRCGDLLHRGSVSKLLTPQSPWPKDYVEIFSWGQKITTLLNSHAIGHQGGETFMFCVLQNPDDSNRVQVAFAQTVPEQDETPAQSSSHRGVTVLPGLHPSKPWRPGK